MSRKKGDSRLARLRTLIGRAEQRCGERAVELAQAHNWLLEIAQRLEPSVIVESGRPPTGAEVRARVEGYLDEIAAAEISGIDTAANAKASSGTTIRRGIRLIH